MKPLIFLFICTLSIACHSQDWNQFRGPNRNGSLQNLQIADTSPELIWKKSLGSGFSEILSQANMLITMCSDTAEKAEFAIAFEANTGKQLWKTRLDSIFIDVDGFGNGPRSTPVVDEGTAFCLTSFGKLCAVSLDDGSIKWQKDFVKEFESNIPRWAFSTSPLSLGNSIIIEIGGTDSRGFASIDKSTGKINWVKGNASSYYCSPTIATINNQTQVVFASDSMLISYDEAGNEIWSHRMPLRYPTATPLFIENNRFFVSSAGNTGGFMVEINEKETKEIFTSTSMKNHFSSSCSHNGYIYGYSNATLRCISAENAEIKWSKRGLGKGTLILVGDKLLALSDKGVLKLIDTNPEMYSELGSFQAITGKSWTAPSYSNGHIYLRNLNEIAVYKLK